MRQLNSSHILLFRILRDHCSFLTRGQIQRILTLPTNRTNEQLQWLLSEQYLRRRYRADTFVHFQTPLYYLGKAGWQMAGKPVDDYRRHRLRIERRSEHSMEHQLAVHDVSLKFLLESEVKRIIPAGDKTWQEAIDFGNIPDGWIQFDGGEVFIEVDLGTEAPSVVRDKFIKYGRFRDTGSYRRLFPDCTFKVLFITTDEERIESLERVVTSDDIWFATMEEFLRERLDHEHWFALYGFYALSALRQKEVPQLSQDIA